MTVGYTNHAKVKPTEAQADTLKTRQCFITIRYSSAYYNLR